MTQYGASSGIKGQSPILSLCMIVRNNAGTLVPCLESIRPWVDEMNVVDTGSTDETPRIAERFGARVFHFPWIDDFSAARNESLKPALGQWLFWMDSDDTISAENGRKLRDLAYGRHAPQTLGYMIRVHCPGPSNSFAEDFVAVDHVKLFRNQPAIRFEGRIHEQVLLPIRRLGGNVAWTDIFVVHSGADYSPEGRRRKYERDLRILHLDLAERPNHPYVLFNFGMTYADMGEYEKAVHYLQRCLDVADPTESQVRKAYAILINSLNQLGRTDEAWHVCRASRRLFPKDPELCFREGSLAHQSKRLDEAVEAFRAALKNDDERHFTSIDRGVVGYKARHNLALVYDDMGRHDLAELQWRLVLDEVPKYAVGQRALVETMLRQRRTVSAEVAIERQLRDPNQRYTGLLLHAELSERRRDLVSARRSLESAIQEFPDSIEPLEALCKSLFDQGDLHAAEQSLSELARRLPEDGSAHHNLGSIYMRTGRLAEAERSCRESLRRRPDSAITHLQHGLALHGLGRTKEAFDACLEAQRLAPHDPSVKNAVQLLSELQR